MNKSKLLNIILITYVLGTVLCQAEEHDSDLQSSNNNYQIVEIQDAATHETGTWLQRKKDKKNLLEIAQKPLQALYWCIWNKELTAFVFEVRLSTKISRMVICKIDKDGSFNRTDHIKDADYAGFEMAKSKIKIDFEIFILSHDPISWISEHEFIYEANFVSDDDTDLRFSYVCKINLDDNPIQEKIIK